MKKIKSSKEEIIRIFTCEKGHSYESKEPISTGNGLPIGVKDAKYLNFLWFKIPIVPPKIIYNDRANDHCIHCGSPLSKEEDFVDGKLLMGASKL